MLRIVTENRILYDSLDYLTGFYMWSPLDTNRKCIPGVVCVTCPTVCVRAETGRAQAASWHLTLAPHSARPANSRQSFTLDCFPSYLGHGAAGALLAPYVWLCIKYISYSGSSVRGKSVTTLPAHSSLHSRIPWMVNSWANLDEMTIWRSPHLLCTQCNGNAPSLYKPDTRLKISCVENLSEHDRILFK